ncbi:MAG: hypothetical protein RMY28_029515 [Nostoc sp. ChiSLP01]|nr:hypothetical protein [Nostoc sp. CmiSLP01]MDZ8282943.1 hypothetical protein [Nostoc sp. ChiSLP01]
MATLNTNIPRFYCYLRKEFLYDCSAHHNEFIQVCVFAVSSISGRALGFHVLTDNGAVIWRLPINAFCHKINAPSMPVDYLQFWDCFSYEITCTKFERLAESRVKVHLKDGNWSGGQYMFTLDWYGNEDSEEAGEGGQKCAHIIALDNGNFCAQPNNRLQWFCPAFVTPFKQKPDYITNTHVWKVEREQETSTGYFYDSNQMHSQEQIKLYAKGSRTQTDIVNNHTQQDFSVYPNPNALDAYKIDQDLEGNGSEIIANS